jgi:diguanylate cyclase (GGDEF)-like protein
MTRRRRPAAVTILFGMTVIAALACVVITIRPLNPAASRQLPATMGVVAGCLAVVLWRAKRVPAALLHAIVLVWLTAITLGIVNAATPQGATGRAVLYTWMLLYTAYFFTERQARTYAALTTLAYLGACVAHPFQGIVAAFLVVMVTCIAGCELLIRMLRQLRTAALQDELTGQPNRAALVSQGSEIIRQARRRGRPLTVALLDLDHFKQINDEFGHAAGDEVLQRVTREWRERLRTGDTLYRSGGDEFVLLLPDATEQQASQLLTRLHETSEIAWCFGLTEVQPDDDLDRALARADKRLYAAKSARVPVPRLASEDLGERLRAAR